MFLLFIFTAMVERLDAAEGELKKLKGEKSQTVRLKESTKTNFTLSRFEEKWMVLSL